MKKVKWNTIVFQCYFLYCVGFIVLFWCVYVNNDLFDEYFELVLNGLLLTLGVNTLSQIWAIITKRSYAIIWLFIGVILFFLTIGFTIGQSA